MSKSRWRIPPEVKAALNATGLPWAVEMGKRHAHIRLAGKMVGVLSMGQPDETFGRSMNILAHIRRCAKEMRP